MDRIFVWAAGIMLSLALRHRCNLYPALRVIPIIRYASSSRIRQADLADVITRLLGNGMSQSPGQSIVVENHPGASGLIGLQAAARAEPDGYTLVMGQMGAVVVAP